MRKLISFGAMLLFCISALGQVPVTVNEKMFVGFQREDGVFVIYDAKGLVTVKDGKFAERLETTELKLSKFLAVTDFYSTLDEARAKLGLPPVTFPVVVENPKFEQNYSWATGQVGSFYGSRYESELSELNYGVSTFRFMGQNVKYPEFDTRKKSTDELSIIDLPTHSIINFAGTGFVSAVEMKLTDETGKEVWYLYDTRGGYHPCIFGDCGSKLRGNNHPDDASRWIKHGKYKLWVKNLSTDKRAIQRITFETTSTNQKFFEVELEPGHEENFELNISKISQGEYKLNCNVFTPR